MKIIVNLEIKRMPAFSHYDFLTFNFPICIKERKGGREGEREEKEVV